MGREIKFVYQNWCAWAYVAALLEPSLHTHPVWPHLFCPNGLGKKQKQEKQFSHNNLHWNFYLYNRIEVLAIAVKMDEEDHFSLFLN